MEDTKLTNDVQMVSTDGAMKKAGAFFFLLMLLEIPLAFLIGFMQNALPADYATLISILFTQGYLLLGAVLYMLVTKTRFRADLQVKKYRISTFFLSLVLLVTAAPMATWLNVFSQLFAKNQASGAIFSVTQSVPAWLGVLIIGCLPGFIEETLFRGIMYSAFRKRSVLTGIVISALSFGLMHMNFNQILYAVYLGVIFALTVEATGSLVSTMIMHMLFNAVNTSYIYILPKLYEFMGQFSEEYANVDMEAAFNQSVTKDQLLPMLVVLTPIAIGGLVLTLLLLKAIAHINGRTFTWEYIRRKKEDAADTNPVNVFLILGWVFCLANAFLNLLAG